MKSAFNPSVAGALQLERPGVPGGLDRTHSPCCANGSLTSPAGHYVSIKWVNRIDQTKREMLAVFYSLLSFFFATASRWQCYSSHHRSQRVCYSLLLRLLRTIDADWDAAAVRGDLVGYGRCAV